MLSRVDDARIDTNVMLDANKSDFVKAFYSAGEIYKKFAKIFLIVGVVWLILSRLGAFIIDDDFKALMSANIFVLMLAMIVPLFSADYSLMRAYPAAADRSLPARGDRFLYLLQRLYKEVRLSFHHAVFCPVFFYCFHLFCRNWLDRDMLKCI